MKIKNQTIVNSIQGIQDFAKKDLPYKVALKISKNIDILEKILEEYNKEYNKLAEKYLVKNENGEFVESATDSNLFLIKEGKIEEYSEKINTLNNFENNVDIYMIDSKDLEDIKISAKTLIAIQFMIEENEED